MGILAGSHTQSYVTSSNTLAGSHGVNSSTKHQRAWLADTYCYEKTSKMGGFSPELDSKKGSMNSPPCTSHSQLSKMYCKTNPCTKSRRCLDEAYKSLLHGCHRNHVSPAVCENCHIFHQRFVCGQLLRYELVSLSRTSRLPHFIINAIRHHGLHTWATIFIVVRACLVVP